MSQQEDSLVVNACDSDFYYRRNSIITIGCFIIEEILHAYIFVTHIFLYLSSIQHDLHRVDKNIINITILINMCSHLRKQTHKNSRTWSTTFVTFGPSLKAQIPTTIIIIPKYMDTNGLLRSSTDSSL